MNNCEHKRTKKNFPFGRKSGAEVSCKKCGMPITKYEINKKIEQKHKGRRNRR